MRRTHRLFASVFIALYAPWLAAAEVAFVPQHGDLIFQGAAGDPLGDLIKGLSQSPIAHCGIIVKDGDATLVIEADALGVVKTPYATFIKAEGGQYRVMRLTKADNVDALVQAALKELGKPYDRKFQMDDKALYCSELVYKAYQKAYGAELAKPRRIADMNYRPHLAAMTAMNQGKAPDLKQQIVLPADLAASDKLQVVDDHLPAGTTKPAGKAAPKDAKKDEAAAKEPSPRESPKTKAPAKPAH
jgi:hypothetical protein